MRNGLRFLALVGLLCPTPALVSQSQTALPAPQSGTGASEAASKGLGNAPTSSRAQAEARELNAAAVRDLAAMQFEQAVELLQRAHRLVPSDLGIAFNLGLAYFKGSHFKEAITPLKLALAGPDQRDTARFLLGSAYFETQQFRLAAAQLEQVRSSPEFGENALYFLEESYRKSGDGPRAEKAFLDLMKLRPDSALVHKLLGTAYDAQGRFAEGLAEFQAASTADPSLPEVRFDAGLLCLKMHDEEAARRWFEGELKLNPCYAAAHYYLGDSERKAGRWAPAAESFRRAIGCAPEYAEAHLALGIALEAQGLNVEALPILRRAVQLAPGTSEAHFQLARSLAKAGRKAEAQAEWTKAQELSALPPAQKR